MAFISKKLSDVYEKIETLKLKVTTKVNKDWKVHYSIYDYNGRMVEAKKICDWH
jgi:hypothetical protein